MELDRRPPTADGESTEEESMNDVPSFLAVTAAIFAAVTGLLMVMSRLESRPRDHDAEDGPQR